MRAEQDLGGWPGGRCVRPPGEPAPLGVASGELAPGMCTFDLLPGWEAAGRARALCQPPPRASLPFIRLRLVGGARE